MEMVAYVRMDIGTLQLMKNSFVQNVMIVVKLVQQQTNAQLVDQDLIDK